MPESAPTSVEESPAPAAKHQSSLAPFNPTCNQAQSTTLSMLNLTSKDILFDLGCGDGRMLLHAAEMTPGLRCVGIELDPVFVGRGREALKALPESVQTRVDIRRGDLLKLLDEIKKEGRPAADCSAPIDDNDTDEADKEYLEGILGKDCRQLSLFQDATALYMFLLPKGIKKIQGVLNELVNRRKQERRPFHAIAYMFSIREWEPAVVDKTTKGDAPLYLYKFVPEESE